MSNVVYRRCCGMDAHKDTIVVGVLPPDRGDVIPARIAAHPVTRLAELLPHNWAPVQA